MSIATMDMGEILTAYGKDFFARRDDSPGNFFVKYGEIWTRFMNDSKISDWWGDNYGMILRTDEQSRLITMPTPEQLLGILIHIRETQNQYCDEYDTYWTDERKIQYDLEDKIIPQRPTRIDIDFERAMTALKGQESVWTGISFTKLFRGLREQKTYRVSTYLIALTLWAIWNPQEDKTITQANALEAIQKRREQNRLNMQKVREMQKAASGFGDHSKELTHRMVQFQNDAKQQDKLRSEIESLQDKLTRIAARYHSNFSWLQDQLESPLTHSESQHSKLEKLLGDIDSTF